MAQQIAETNGNQAVETGHLLKGIFLTDKDVTPYILKKSNVNPEIIEKALDRIIEGYPKVEGGNLYLSQNTHKVLNYALSELKTFGDDFVAIELILYSLIDAGDTIGSLLKDNKLIKNTL